MALLGLVVGADLISSLCHLHVFRLPEYEGIDGRRGPRPARPAVAIPHCLRLPGHLHFDGAAEACAEIDIAHKISPSFMAIAGPGREGRTREGQADADGFLVP